jgi:hypothetical protein
MSQSFNPPAYKRNPTKASTAFSAAFAAQKPHMSAHFKNILGKMP